jgi:hypothetical protein
MSSNNAYTKPHSDFSFPSMILSNWKVPTAAKPPRTYSYMRYIQIFIYL